jgi:hypothetical protein
MAGVAKQRSHFCFYSRPLFESRCDLLNGRIVSYRETTHFASIAGLKRSRRKIASPKAFEFCRNQGQWD